MCPQWGSGEITPSPGAYHRLLQSDDIISLNAPEADVLPGVADFDFAFARFGLGAGVDSSSWSGLLEDEEVVEAVESLESDSK